MIDEARAREAMEPAPPNRDEMLLTIAQAVSRLRKATVLPYPYYKRWSEQHPFTKLEKVIEQLKEELEP